MCLKHTNSNHQKIESKDILIQIFQKKSPSFFKWNYKNTSHVSQKLKSNIKLKTQILIRYYCDMKGVLYLIKKIQRWRETVLF